MDRAHQMRTIVGSLWSQIWSLPQSEDESFWESDITSCDVMDQLRSVSDECKRKF